MTPEEVGAMMLSRMKEEQAHKVRNFRELNKFARKGAILFTGSSLMEQFPICELAAGAGIGKTIYNRGIGGTTSEDFLREIDTVLLDLAPSKVFLNIGTNDMTDRIYGCQWMAHWEANYERILKTAKQKLPDTEIYCMAYYPTNHHLPNSNEWTRAMLKERTLENLNECNRRLQAMAERYGFHYIDVNHGLTDDNGELKQEFAIDGVHMWSSAYLVVFDNLRKFI